MVLGIPGVQHGARAVLDERQANLRPRRRVQITFDVDDFGTNGDRSSTIGGEHPPGVTSDFRQRWCHKKGSRSGASRRARARVRLVRIDRDDRDRPFRGER